MPQGQPRVENIEPRLRAISVSAGYAATPILSDVSLDIPNGQLTVLVGPNGSGKSTLLKTMARILAPQAGSVLLDGKAIHQSRTRDVARALGLLPQGPVPPEGLTVRELVAQGRFPHQGLLRQWNREDADAVEQALATTRVAEFADRAVDSLSGGQRQRCWIAMVLAQQTPLLLLDEPTTFLDLKVQIDLMEMLADLAHSGGRTLVVVLHDLSLAATYADVLVMLRDGRVVCAGSAREVFTAARLKAVFDLEVRVTWDAETDQPICLPIAPHAQRRHRTRAA